MFVSRFMRRFNGVFTWVYLTEWIACISTLCLACYLSAAVNILFCLNFSFKQKNLLLLLFICDLQLPATLPNIMKNLTLFFTGTNTFSVLCYVGQRYTTVVRTKVHSSR